MNPSSRRARARPPFFLYEENKIRLQYCEDETLRATDWHTHVPDTDPAEAERRASFFGTPGRTDPRRPWHYDNKPMVSVGWQDAETLCQ